MYILKCTLFCAITAFGGGMPLVVLIVTFRRYSPLLHLGRYSLPLCHDKIPHVVLGGGDKGGATVMPLLSNNQTPRECIKRPAHSNADKENCCFGENPPPPKRGRKRSLDSTHRCGSCTVWLQTGGSTEMLKHHRMDIGRVRHPGERVSDFNKFLSCNGIYKSICLRSDSCLNYVMHVTETV